MDPDPVPAGDLGCHRTGLGLRCRARRDRLRRVHQQEQGPTRALPAHRAPGQTAPARTCDGTVQGELFAAYRYHPFITNSRLGLVEADQTHRGHAIIEQTIADLKANALAHLPSGKYAANAAWLAFAVITFNLLRATAILAGPRHARTRWATLRTRLISVPARLASTGRRLILHLPASWPWAQAWDQLHATAHGPPAAAMT